MGFPTKSSLFLRKILAFMLPSSIPPPLALTSPDPQLSVPTRPRSNVNRFVAYFRSMQIFVIDAVVTSAPFYLRFFIHKSSTCRLGKSPTLFQLAATFQPILCNLFLSCAMFVASFYSRSFLCCRCDIVFASNKNFLLFSWLEVGLLVSF